MDDYISRQAAIRIVCDDECEDCPDGGCDMYRRLKRLPAADVRPVMRGKWIRGNESRTGPTKDSYICSVCGEKTLSGFCGNPAKTNFCPNCGCAMESEK